MQRLSPLTALSILDIRTRLQSGWYEHDCAACGDVAVANGDHVFCRDVNCKLGVGNALDTLAAGMGWDYEAAVESVGSRTGRKLASFKADVMDADNSSKVMRWWRSNKTKPADSIVQSQAFAKLRSKGNVFTDSGCFGVMMLQHSQIKSLLELADSTGGRYDISKDSIPKAALAYAVQTTPEKIDTIVVNLLSDKSVTIKWENNNFGVVGLGGAHPDRKHFIYSSDSEAIQGSSNLKAAGLRAGSMFLHKLPKGDDPYHAWCPGVVGGSSLVVRSVRDLSPFASWYTLLPYGEDTCLAVSEAVLTNVGGRKPREVSWSKMRKAILISALARCDRYLTPECEHIIDVAGLSQAEGADIVARIMSAGNVFLGEQLRRRLSVRTIYKKKDLSIIENASDYVLRRGKEFATIANFVLRFKHNLYMRSAGEIYHRAELVFGSKMVDVSIPAGALDNPNKLQESVRNQLLGLTDTSVWDSLPTVADTGAFRKYLTPYMRRTVGNLTPVEGVDSLGWDSARQRFIAPGARFTMDGSIEEDSAFSPGVPILKVMNAKTVWDHETIHTDIPKDLRDVIAVVISEVVNSYLYTTSKPLIFDNDSVTRNTLLSMFSYLGQDRTYELNASARDAGGVRGVSGFPILVSGYTKSQAQAARFNHIVLADNGHSLQKDYGEEVIAKAGRTLQYAVRRTVEWCIATSAVEFTHATSHSLMGKRLKEGKWLMEHVCEVQPWEVNLTTLHHIEHMVSSVKAEDLAEAGTIHPSSMSVVIETIDMPIDIDGVVSDLRKIGVISERQGSTLTIPMTESSELFSQYYGTSPEFKVDVSRPA